MKVNFNILHTSFPKVLRNNKTNFLIFGNSLQSDVFVRENEGCSEAENIDEHQIQVPEYLYHLTNRTNFEHIKETGKIKPSEDIIDGVFMFDMNDFNENWKSHSYDKTTPSVAASLLLQAITSDNELVLIQIPTKNLNLKKIRIRPQDDVCEFIKSPKYRNLCLVHAESGGAFKHKSDFPRDLVKGYDVLKAKDFFNQGRPIEYIYQGSIKVEPEIIENVTRIPNVTSDCIRKAKTDELATIFDEFKEG